MFTINFDSDSSEENEANFNIKDSTPKINQIAIETQSLVINSGKKQNDKYLPNPISKSIFFHQDDVDLIYQNDHQENKLGHNASESPKKSTNENKSIRRKKVNANLKLEPLKNLQITKKSQTISLLKAPLLMKTQSQPNPCQSNKSQEQSFKISTKNVQQFCNIEVISSSNESDKEQTSGSFRTPNKNDEKQSNKLKLDLSANVFFQDSEEQDNLNDKNINQNTPQKKTQQKIYVQQSEQRFNAVSDEQQYEQQKRQKGKIEVQNEPNPEISKNNILQRNVSTLEDFLDKTKGPNLTQNSQFENLKSLLFQNITRNSVLNLRLIRNQSLLNFLSPEFRIEYHHDHYFIMNSKKTSSKPTSTFTFSGSLFTFDESSKKYLGKMKSNIGGDLYNIFGPGLNPSRAIDKNVPPRQLLATILYKTEVFGTSKPKELTVFVKKPQCQYYKDLRGVKMYDDEVPLNQLFDRYFQNRQHIQIFHSRKPIYNRQTKEHVMNFGGKVKKASVKNFILQDRQNQNQKVLLFGKVADENFVLDIYHPMTPIVGIGVALTMFDSRLGVD